VLRIVVLCVLTKVALAEPPPRELAKERTVLLGGAVSVRLPDGMIAAEDSAALDWDGARFTVGITQRANVTEGELQRQLTMRIARVERITMRPPWTAYVVVPRAPRRSEGRAEVLAVYARDPRGTLIVLAFAIDDAGFDDAERWAALARRSAATLITATPPPSPPSPSTNATGTTARIGRGKRYCDVEDNVPYVRTDSDSSPDQMVGGTLRGEHVYWFLWADRRGVHAEAITRASESGRLHVVCHAQDRKQLDTIRAVAERQLSSDGETP
jgi:hypothetical protein